MVSLSSSAAKGWESMADHVFISYDHDDQDFVLPLAERLRERGVEVWIDQREIGYGMDWDLTIEKALYGCAWFLIVLSPASVRSREVRGELRIALNEEKRMLPVLYQACRIPRQLQLVQYVDCAGRGAEDEGLLREVLGALGVQDPGVEQSEAVGRPAAAPDLEAAAARFRLGREALVRIPEGPFWIGSPEGEGEDREHPQHEVPLAEFYLMWAPVTNAQYRLFVEDGGYEEGEWWTEAGWEAKEKNGWSEPRYWGDGRWNRPEQPVVGVSWYEALAFAHWAGGTLPSEAEWEKAASWDPEAGRKRRYPWGDEWDATRCNTIEEGLRRTTPVGQYSPRGDSAYGLVDMAGNVWEWTRSRLAGYPYAAGDGREGLEGAAARVVRGGAFDLGARLARCACRYWPSPD